MYASDNNARMCIHYLVALWALPFLCPSQTPRLPENLCSWQHTSPKHCSIAWNPYLFILLLLNQKGQNGKDVFYKDLKNIFLGKLQHHSWGKCWEVIFRSSYRPEGFTGPKTNREGNSRSVHSAKIHCCCHAIIISTLGLVVQPFCKALIIHCILWTLFVSVAFPLTPSCSLFLSPPPSLPPSSLQGCVSVGCGVTSLLVGPSCVIERLCFPTSFLSKWNEAGLPGYLQKMRREGLWRPATIEVCSTVENFRWDISIESASLPPQVVSVSSFSVLRSPVKQVNTGLYSFELQREAGACCTSWVYFHTFNLCKPPHNINVQS